MSYNKGLFQFFFISNAEEKCVKIPLSKLFLHLIPFLYYISEGVKQENKNNNNHDNNNNNNNNSKNNLTFHVIMYVRIVLGFVPTFFTSKYSFSSGVGYVMPPILLIMWAAFQSFIPRDNNHQDLRCGHDMLTLQC